MVEFCGAIATRMAFHLDLGLRIALEPSNCGIKSFQGTWNKLSAPRLERHTRKFRTSIVKDNGNPPRASRTGNIWSLAAFKRAGQAFAQNRVSIFTWNMETRFALHVRRHHHLLAFILTYKRKFFTIKI